MAPTESMFHKVANGTNREQEVWRKKKKAIDRWGEQKKKKDVYLTKLPSIFDVERGL